MKTINTHKILVNCTKKQIFIIIILIILMIAISYLKLKNSLIIVDIIDKVVPNKDVNLLIIIIIKMISISLSLLLLDIFKTFLSTKLGNYITSSLRRTAFECVLNAKYLKINKYSDSQVMSRITRETGKIGEVYFVNDIVGFFSESIFLLIVVITMIKIDKKFAIIIFALFPLFYFLAKFISKISKKNDKEYIEILESGQELILTSCKRIKKIKITNGHQKENEKFNLWLDSLYKHKKKTSITHSLNRFIMGDLIINIMYIVIIFIGIWYIIKDFSTITTGILISFLTIIPKIYSSFRVLLNVNISSKIIKNSMEKLDEIYSIEPETNIYDGINIDDIYSIEFIDVSFKYGDGLFEVKKLNFKVEKGEKLGIVGMSGGGKTTLFDLITRIIIPNEGQILINNIDLNKISLFSLRNNIEYVQQDLKLFNVSIRDNIIYPLEFDEKNYQKSIEEAKLNNLIESLPEKDKTKISNYEDNLSGGEIQRINIANAIYKNAKLFLLDEITSALDVTNEKDILSKLYKMNDKIMLITSHRIYNILNCDKVIVMNDGKIIEYGTIKQLRERKNSTFNNMLKKISDKI